MARVVVALGGNALLRRGEPVSASTQRDNIRRAATALARLMVEGHQLVVTHGNGPQVGLLALQGEAAGQSGFPLDVLGAETEGMIGEALIGLMKKDAIFVNTARAVVVQREALLSAIENNAIRGAILDVFDHEPPDELDYRLIHHRNVLATPHIAGATFEVEDHHADIMNKALRDFYIEGNRNIRQLVNREVLPVKTH